MHYQPFFVLVLGLAAIGIAAPILEPVDVVKPVNDLQYKYGRYAGDKREVVNDLQYKYGRYAGDKREVVNDLQYKYGKYAGDKREVVNDLQYKYGKYATSEEGAGGADVDTSV